MAGKTSSDGVEALLAEMLRLPLYVLLREVQAPERLSELLEEHLRYMLKLEAEGHLFASGPLEHESGTMAGSLTVLRASDATAARALADADPFVREGVMTYELRRWTVMEGGLQLRVSFGAGTFDLR